MGQRNGYYVDGFMGLILIGSTRDELRPTSEEAGKLFEELAKENGVDHIITRSRTYLTQINE